MKYSKKILVKPGSLVQLKDFDPDFDGKHEKKKSAISETMKMGQKMDELKYKLYVGNKHQLLIILQALDASSQDVVVRHIIGSMNPQGCQVISFKQPTHEELSHDFLWRIELQIPKPGEVVIFNRSQYEDVLIARVHELVPKEVWLKRYEMINEFEQKLEANGTRILKFFLHISKEEQLQCFKERLDDPARQWKISEADYSEREYWADYEIAYEDALSKCNSSGAPWFVIPSDHKWFRNLAISEIILKTMESIGIELPLPTVNIKDIRRKYLNEVENGENAIKK